MHFIQSSGHIHGYYSSYFNSYLLHKPCRGQWAITDVSKMMRLLATATIEIVYSIDKLQWPTFLHCKRWWVVFTQNIAFFICNYSYSLFCRGKRNIRNILIFVCLCNIRSTIFRKEYSFSKKAGYTWENHVICFRYYQHSQLSLVTFIHGTLNLQVLGT